MALNDSPALAPRDGQELSSDGLPPVSASTLGDCIAQGRLEQALAFIESRGAAGLAAQDWASAEHGSRSPLTQVCSGHYEMKGEAPEAAMEIKLVRALIGAGCPLDGLDRHGQSALSWAAHQGNASLAQLLIDAKADLDNHGSEQPPLIRAFCSPHPTGVAVAWMLLRAGAEVDATRTTLEGEPSAPIRLMLEYDSDDRESSTSGASRRALAILSSFDELSSLDGAVDAARAPAKSAPRI